MALLLLRLRDYNGSRISSLPISCFIAGFLDCWHPACTEAGHETFHPWDENYLFFESEDDCAATHLVGDVFVLVGTEVGDPLDPTEWLANTARPDPAVLGQVREEGHVVTCGGNLLEQEADTQSAKTHHRFSALGAPLGWNFSPT